MSNFFLLKLDRELLTLSILVILISLLALGCSSESENPTKTQKEVDQTETKKQPAQEEVSPYDKPECTTPDIKLEQGKLCGLIEDVSSGKHANSYLGIPFAESTAGENRWRPPVPDQGWEGVYKATSFGPSCPQKNIFYPDLPVSEDCLSVNVWSPKDKSQTPKPVMVFIYGGAFMFGNSSEPTYDGSYISTAGDVVVVSFNYRLASLGFLAGLKDEKTGEELNGNFGFLDQILALKWVQYNISAFGGDPEKVTIFGESAGAMSAGIHLTASPESKNLFRAAIMESNPLGFPYKNIDQARPIAKHFAESLDCSPTDIKCLRSKSLEEILSVVSIVEHIEDLVIYGLTDFLIWGPVIDGEIFTGHPLGEISDNRISKPFIIGTNKNEGVTFVGLTLKKLDADHMNELGYSVVLDLIFRDDQLKKEILTAYPKQEGDNTKILGKLLTDYLFSCPSLYFAGQASAQSWAYRFDKISDYSNFKKIGLTECNDAVCHASELVFVFHTADKAGYSFTPEEDLLSKLMVTYWTDFAKNLNPNNGSIMWPEYSSNHDVILFNTPVDQISATDDPKSNCEFWDNVGYDLHTSFWNIF